MNEKASKLKGQYLLSILFPVLSIVLRLPIRHQPLWGDDALLLRASRMPHGYASSFLEAFTQTGSFKFRPLASPLLSLAIHLFGNDIYWYKYFNTVLIGILGYAVFRISLRLSNQMILSIVAGVVVVVTRFNWYSQDYVFGIMEMSALILFVLSVHQLIRALMDASPSAIVASQVLLLASTLVHERYIIVSIMIPLAVVIALSADQTTRLNPIGKRSLAFLAIPIIHVILKSGLLGVSPLTGGGESDFNSVKGPWILKHFVQSVTSIFGWSSGYGDAARRMGIGSAWFVVFGVIGLTTFVALLAHKALMRSREKSSDLLVGFTLLSVFGAVVMSASLVIERIEYRWLFAPLIMGILMIAWIARSGGSFRIASAHTLVCLILCAEVLYQPYHRVVALSPSRVAAAVEVLKSRQATGPWKLVVLPRNWEPSWQWWSFAYGDVFNSLPNPPNSISLVGDLKSASAACRYNWSRPTCTLLVIDGQSTDVEAVDFRPAKYRN